MNTNIENRNRLLVLTDFSEVCYKAILQSIEFAKCNKSDIYILHISDNYNNETPKDYLQQIQKDTSLCKHKHLVASNIFELLNNKDFNVELIIKKGEIIDITKMVSKEIDTDMIILGTHGKKGMQKYSGSNILKIVESTYKPVMVIHEKSTISSFKNIVFPVNIHEDNQYKIQLAKYLSILNNAKIHIFVKEETITENIKLREEILHKIKNCFNTNHLEYKIMHENKNLGDFDNQVLTYSNITHSDAIVIGYNPLLHNGFGGGNEEFFIYNKFSIPIVCIYTKKQIF
jgi:nucleotide-binding universal stress UspA family protein